MRQASRVRPIAAPEIYRMRLFGASVVATIPVLILFALIERRVVGGLRRARSSSRPHQR